MPSTEPEPGRRTATEAQRATRAMQRAERLAERGQVAAAIATLNQALRLGADPSTCYLRMARLHQTCQQLREAVSAAERAIAENPANLSAREALVALNLESRDYAAAVRASKDLLKLAPRHVPARDALGAAYVGLGDVDAAMRVANDLVRLDPGNAAHHFTKAVLCQHRGAVGMAIDEFERVLFMAPDTDLAESAREQLDSLDAFQLQQILTLAMEDSIFRARLIQDTESAPMARGFSLSDQGRQRLLEFVQAGLDELETGMPPRLYH